MKAILRTTGSVVVFFLLASQAIAQVEAFKEDFEDQFPGTKWTLGDNTSTSGLDYWRDRAGIAYNGSWAGWCAEEGDSAGISNSLRGTYDNYMDAFMQASFNLSNAYTATIEFWYYIPSIDVGYDSFVVQVSSDGSSWQSIFLTSTTTYNWSYFSYPLNSYLNDPSVYVRFRFHSDDIITAEGAFVDDIRVTKNCEPADQLFSGFSVSNSINKRYYYNQSFNYWSVSGVRPPSSSDWDIEIYGDGCFTPESLKADSRLGTGSVDFVVANYNFDFAPTGNDYIKILLSSGGALIGPNGKMEPNFFKPFPLCKRCLGVHPK